MKQTLSLTMVFALAAAVHANPSFAQGSGGQPSLAGTLGIYVFPAKGQDATQQSEDEAACYQWAVSNSGSDPFEAQKAQAANAQQAQATQEAIAQSGKGAGARGAVGGAAVGALVGEIADDDAGKGAAWGAGVGLVASRRHARRAQAEASSEAAASAEQTQQATQTEIDNFKKAFSACMEGKNYIAKF